MYVNAAKAKIGRDYLTINFKREKETAIPRKREIMNQTENQTEEKNLPEEAQKTTKKTAVKRVKNGQKTVKKTEKTVENEAEIAENEPKTAKKEPKKTVKTTKKAEKTPKTTVKKTVKKEEKPTKNSAAEEAAEEKQEAVKAEEPVQAAPAVTLTRAEKVKRKKALLNELLSAREYKWNELLDTATKIYTERYTDEKNEPNDLRGGLGSAFDVMEKGGEVRFDKKTNVCAVVTKPETKAEVKFEVKEEEKAAEEQPAKEEPKKRGRKKAVAEEKTAKTAESQEAIKEEIKAEEPKKRGRKKVVKAEEKPAEKEEQTPVQQNPAPVESEKAEVKAEEKSAEEQPEKEEPKTVEKAEEKTATKIEVKAEEKAAKPAAPVFDMTLLFGAKTEKKPVQKEAKAEQKPATETKTEAKTEEKAEIKTEAKTEQKTEEKSEQKTEKKADKPVLAPVAPMPAPHQKERAEKAEKQQENKENKGENKPENKPENKSENRGDTRREQVRGKSAQQLSRRSGKSPVRVAAPKTEDELLKEEFLRRLRSLGGEYFEYYAIYLLERYSLRNGRRLEGLRISGGDQDGGVDGEIVLTDKFGFRETIYIQCKNWDPSKGDTEKWVVGETLLQQFIGAVACKQAKEGKRKARGIFVTTSLFTEGAKEILDAMSADFIGYDGSDVYETAKECKFGLLQKDGKWVLDEKLLSGGKAFFELM